MAKHVAAYIYLPQKFNLMAVNIGNLGGSRYLKLETLSKLGHFTEYFISFSEFFDNKLSSF